MRVIQSVVGVFHHFDLAHQLHQRGYLQKIYSTFPWFRLKREGLPRELVETFPWLQTPNYVLQRSRFYPAAMTARVDRLNNLLFDEWVSRRRRSCDALIAISGTGLKTGVQLQREGGVYICDRGSTHHRYQAQVIAEEHRRWNVALPPAEPKVTLREEECYEVADAITVPSTVAKRSFVAMGVRESKVHVIPYGARLKSFDRAAGPDPDRFDVLFAGHVSLRKGIPYLLEAFARVRHPNKQLTIVGSVHESIRELLARLPIASVTFTGSLPQQLLAQKMGLSHVMVLPSVEEGLALVQGQAMASGCPVIATPETGSEDLFTNGREGFIVPGRDVDALAERMQQLADDTMLQKQMSEAAYQTVKYLGGWEQYGDLWQKLLLELVPSRVG